MKRRGFTLVELLVVVVIVSGIAWAATPDRPRPFVAGPMPVAHPSLETFEARMHRLRPTSLGIDAAGNPIQYHPRPDWVFDSDLRPDPFPQGYGDR